MEVSSGGGHNAQGKLVSRGKKASRVCYLCSGKKLYLRRNISFMRGDYQPGVPVSLTRSAHSGGTFIWGRSI